MKPPKPYHAPEAQPPCPELEPSSRDPGKGIFFAVLACASLLVGVGLLLLMLMKAEMLARFGLVGQVYYIVLIPFGFSGAMFLFGVLRSYGHYKGHLLGGTIELGGAVIAFFLLVVLGFKL